jgi:hypothetical protein
MGYDYFEAKDILDSGVPSRLSAVANVWRNFGVACRSVSDHLSSTSTTVGAQHGATYQIVSDRSGRMSTWLETLAGQADLVGSGLADAGGTGTTAQYQGDYIDYKLNQKVQAISPDGAMSVGRINAMNAAIDEAATAANAELRKWSAAYDAFQPGQVAPAPVTSGGGGTDNSTNTQATTVQPTQSTSTQTQPTDQSNDRITNGPDQPRDLQFESSVTGKEAGDFEGWVRDPGTGYLVDPTTGREFDPVTGRWIDPVTGKPFGDVVQYASRLEGLSGGTGGSPLAAGGGGVGYAPLFGGGLGAGNVAGLYGGAIPPSLMGNNPAAAQLRGTAANEMVAKAYAASQLGAREAAAGGRPFVPPMQAGGHGAAAGRGGASRNPRARLLAESARTWTAGGRAPTPRDLASGGGRGQAGARPYVPPTTGAGTKAAADDRTRPDWLVEDDVWSSGAQATGGVLGEDR